MERASRPFDKFFGILTGETPVPLILYHAPMNAVAHGIDLVDIARIERMLDEHDERFRQRVFTKNEQAYCDAATHRRAERYAARFAAKEAVLKALGTGWRNGIAWTDIEVVRKPSGEPALNITGKCAEIANDMGITHWLISISHAGETSGGFAMASVIGCQK